MDIINVVFTALSEIMTGVVGVISNAFTGVVSLWYTAPSGSNGTGQLTLLGVLSLIAFVFGIVWLAIKFIGSMISLKTAR